MQTTSPETPIHQQKHTDTEIIRIAHEPFVLQSTPFTSELDALVHNALSEHEKARMTRIGIQPTQAYSVTDNAGTIIAVIAFRLFWGALHIKYLYVHTKYRGKGVGTMLMKRVIATAHQKNCPFLLVETTSYQALNFYRQFGFAIEFSREGFEEGVSFHYLRKTL